MPLEWIYLSSDKAVLHMNSVTYYNVCENSWFYASGMDIGGI